MHGTAGVKKVAGTGTEQPRFRSGKQGIASSCDAKCDAISANRIELLARAVILVAGMNIPGVAREAVLARVTAELANASVRRRSVPTAKNRSGGDSFGGVLQSPNSQRCKAASRASGYRPPVTHQTLADGCWPYYPRGGVSVAFGPTSQSEKSHVFGEVFQKRRSQEETCACQKTSRGRF